MKPDKKTIKKSFRITEEEEEFLRRECQKYAMTDSAFFRKMLLRERGLLKEETKTQKEYLALKELTNEINHIGVNINQIARHTNMQFYTEKEKKKLFSMMQEIKQKVMEL